jgi:hypothetical protein
VSPRYRTPTMVNVGGIEAGRPIPNYFFNL